MDFTVVTNNNDLIASIGEEEGDIIVANGYKVLASDNNETEEFTPTNIDLADINFVKDKMNVIGDMANTFKKLATEVVANENYYREKGVESIIDLRENCYAIHYALRAAISALINLYNIDGMLPCNNQKEQK